MLKLAEDVDLLDGVINSAGVSSKVLIPNVTQVKIDALFRINVTSQVLLLKNLLKRKKINNSASIVYVSSISGVQTAAYGNVLYSMSKSALQGLVKNAALDLAKRGIRVNSVNPGLIVTPLFDQINEISGEQFEAELKRYPLRRYGLPEDVAHGIIYLLSDASKWVTGTSLVIDGGVTIR